MKSRANEPRAGVRSAPANPAMIEPIEEMADAGRDDRADLQCVAN
jgi:hypothetical protein